MATDEERSFDSLVDEALKNARADRKRILAAYEDMREALDAGNAEKTVMMGQTAAKLLEQLNKVNEQIVKLAQVKERQESKTAEKKDGKVAPLDIDEIRAFVENKNTQSN